VILLGGLDLAARVSVRWPAGRLVDRKAYSDALGKRANIPSPRRKVKLSQPPLDTG
jgi:hypothetical protein